MPLDWCFRSGVKLDFRHFSDGYVVTADDVENELKRIGHALQPLEIVVVNTTAAGDAYGSDRYVASGCGMGRDATMYLLEQGVRVTGTDARSWDAPLSIPKINTRKQRMHPLSGKVTGREWRSILSPGETS